MKDAPIEMAPITEASLPKTTEQQILYALLRIEAILIDHFDEDEEDTYDGPPLNDLIGGALRSGAIKPTDTPFLRSLDKKKKR